MDIGITLRNAFKGVCLMSAIAGGLGLHLYGSEIIDKRPERNQRYQGYRTHEGRRVLVFDPERNTERVRQPQRFSGNEEELGLTLFEDYNLIIGIPRWNRLYGERVISATPVKSE